MTALGPGPEPAFPAAALLLDLDGVLADSTHVIQRHWREFAAWYDLDAAHVMANVHGRRASDVITTMLAGRDPGVIARALRRFDRLEVDDVAGITALPGGAALLAGLPHGSWAVVTAGTRAVAARRLAAAGLPVPTVLVGADDVRHGKPDPESYLEAAGRLGVRPNRCVVLEDSPSGILAGRAAESFVIGVATTHVPAQLGDAHAVVPDLRSVAAQPVGDLLAVSVRRLPAAPGVPVARRSQDQPGETGG